MNGQKSYCTDDYFPYFRIQYENNSKGLNMSHYHFHNTYEIYFLLHGERYYFIDDKIYQIKSGDIVLLNQHIMHKTSGVENPQRYERACFYIEKAFQETLGETHKKADLFACFNKNSRVIRLNDIQKNFMEALISKVNNECLNTPDMYNAYVETLITELLIFINRCVKDQSAYVPEFCNVQIKKIHDIVTFIDEHYMEDMSLPLIINKFGVSASWFTKTFKTATGFTFIDYLNNIRIKHAYEFLDQPHLNISEVALKVGYSNITHFGRVFKEITGYSPSQYRHLNKFQIK